MSRLFNKDYSELIEQLPSYEEYQYWEYLQDRKIIFNQDVDLNIVNRAILNIIKWNEEDDKLGLVGESRPSITIYITSNGGCVISGMALLDVMKESKTQIKTVGIGICASMGALLLIGGHHRSCYKNTTVLLHDGSLALQSTSKKAKQTMAFYDELELRTKNFILENTKISEELYNRKEDEEWYLFGDQAYEIGIVDELI